uniref:ATP synthase F0 subunit 8 n=1 Tax=Elaphe anomala TaxID=201452 RepID=A0A0F6T624_9SAUR|nr:ATP synthase F0 subunit 8 [Elaphe anomala]AKE32285.1 ATP synthase F0 subunit 8 [Elaphe anomala]
MPQLDTVYILMTHLWAWTTLCLMMQKNKTTMMTTNPVIHPTPKSMTPTQWL